MKKILILLSLLTLGTLVSVGLSGCGDAGGFAKTDAPVALYITDVNTGGNGSYYESDVCVGDGEFCTFFADVIDIAVEVKPIDPNIDPTSQYMDVIVKGYEIKYFRKDTGWNVPATFTETANTYCAIEESVPMNVIICRADMKNDPPLSYLWQFGYEPETGLEIIHTYCEITVWGDTLAGQEVVSHPARLSVNFANYAG